ncbi:MAG: patatin-like phospholipase family protein [Bacillus sp. (in: firmicutes)]
MQIDAVFSGGGIKGYSLIGAYQVLQEKGFVIQRCAGTSAGSILAALILAGYTGKEIEELFIQLELEKFLDSRIVSNIPFLKWLILYKKLGLYKGDRLEAWMDGKLKEKGISTFGDLPKGSLRIVASDVTNGTIAVLPDDLGKYHYDDETFSIAKAVRMSCSVPYFFEPVNLKSKKHPLYIVDGGVLSNFPMWLFDQENVKKLRPVLGIKLSGSKEELPPRKILNAIQMFGALFETMKDAHDNRYISRKHEKNIIFIPNQDTILLDMDIEIEKKKKLIQTGRSSAQQFLRSWTY